MGLSTRYSGNGFSDMHFKTEAVPKADFDAWAKETKNGGGPTLSSQAYKGLSLRSTQEYAAIGPGVAVSAREER